VSGSFLRDGMCACRPSYGVPALLSSCSSSICSLLYTQAQETLDLSKISSSDKTACTKQSPRPGKQPLTSRYGQPVAKTAQWLKPKRACTS
jgi:hypothetical protein